LAAISTAFSGFALAQETGKVISSTPVLKRVTEPRSTCTNDADGRQRCRTEMITEDRNIGYKVVYEYAGRQHTVQLPFPPGPTIELEVTPTALSAPVPATTGAPTPTYTSSERVYVEPIERVYREPAYVDRVYYSRPYPYYYSDYYASPVYPLLGVALGYSLGVGRWGYGHRWVGHHRWR
jgi:hypothetical protein